MLFYWQLAACFLFGLSAVLGVMLFAWIGEAQEQRACYMRCQCEITRLKQDNQYALHQARAEADFHSRRMAVLQAACREFVEAYEEWL